MARDIQGGGRRSGGGGGFMDRVDDTLGIERTRPRTSNPFGGGGPPPAGGGSRSGSGSRSGGTRAPLGVEPGHTVITGTSTQGRTATDRMSGMQLGGGQMARGGFSTPITQSPRYYDGDQDVPGSFSADRVMELQQNLAKTGLLTGNFTLGYYDETTRKAYQRLLEMANRAGLDADQLLQEMTGMAGATGGGTWGVDEFGNIVRTGEGSGSELPPLVTRTTDPSVLRQVFRRAVIEQLGEGWDKGQIDGMVAAYNKMEQDRQKAAYDQQLTGGSYVDIPSPEGWIAAQAQERDPARAQKHEAMSMMDDTLGMLADTAWGVG